MAESYIYLIPEEDREDVLLACSGHDAIEDARVTYNDIEKLTNTRVADIIYAVTNEKGKTRKDRANSKYYEEMRAVQYAIFVKLCDRYANTLFGTITGSSQTEMYQKEFPKFMDALESEELENYADLAGDLEAITVGNVPYHKNPEELIIWTRGELSTYKK